MNRFRNTACVIQTIILGIASMVLFCVIARFVLAPIMPGITMLAVVVLTVLTFDRLWTFYLSVGGIALYLASWPATGAWGTVPGLLIWSVGVTMWFVGVYKSLRPQTITVPLSSR